MSYYATCTGTLTFKSFHSLEVEREAKALRRVLLLLKGNYGETLYEMRYEELLKKVLCSLQPYDFEFYSVKAEPSSHFCVDFYGYEKYDYLFEEFLSAIAPTVFSGLLEFTGDDNLKWRFRFYDEEFHEEEGEVIYEGEGYVAPQKYLPVLEQSTVTLDGKTFVVLSEDLLRGMGFHVPEQFGKQSKHLRHAFNCSLDAIARALLLSASDEKNQYPIL